MRYASIVPTSASPLASLRREDRGSFRISQASFGAGEIRVDLAARSCCVHDVAVRRAASSSSQTRVAAAALPDDRVVQRLAGAAVEDDERLPLVRDAQAEQRRGRCSCCRSASTSPRRPRRSARSPPRRARPSRAAGRSAGARRERLVDDAGRRCVEQHRLGGRRALVDGKDVAMARLRVSRRSRRHSGLRRALPC